MAELHPVITFQVNFQTVDWQDHLVPDRYRQDQDYAVEALNNQSDTRSSTILINNQNLKHGDKFTLCGQEALRWRAIADAGTLPIVECSASEDVNCVPDIGGEADTTMSATAVATMLPSGSPTVSVGGNGYSVSDTLDVVGGTKDETAQLDVSDFCRWNRPCRFR
jgi:hypothetical protein